MIIRLSDGSTATLSQIAIWLAELSDLPSTPDSFRIILQSLAKELPSLKKAWIHGEAQRSSNTIVDMWYQGKSYREIAAYLGGTGVFLSHAAVRNHLIKLGLITRKPRGKKRRARNATQSAETNIH